MNGPLWGLIREYIAAEVALGIQRHSNATEVSCNNARVRELEEQSTRTETAIRKGIEAYDKQIESIAGIATRAQETANEANSHHARY